MDYTDKATRVRPGEELDPSRLERFLKENLPELSGTLEISQFPSGYSNLTYLLRMGDHQMVLRRPPLGTKAKTAHDMGREYRILKALKPVFSYVPQPLIYSEDPEIMGSPFYVMERIPGIILRKDLPKGLNLSPEQMRGLCQRLLDVHLELHSVDYQTIGLSDFGKPQGYVRRQVEGWSQRYRAARTEDGPDFEAVMAWIQEKMPPDTDHPAVIHNDYRFDNVVLDPQDPLRIIGVLDWEMATIGDPLMDLGNSLAYWIQSDDPPEMAAIRLVPTHLDGALTREAMVARYAQKSGRLTENFDFYYCFGLFRLAVIAQQIYYRYFHGQTHDPRFQSLIFAVKTLEKAALKVMEHSRL